MFETKNYELFCGDSLDVLKKLEDNSVNCCITSPPYYGLRDYGTAHWEGGDPNCPHYRQNKVQKEHTNTGHANTFSEAGGIGDAIYKTVCPLCGAVRVDKQVGLEETPEKYIERLVDIFHEVKRVLKDDGTLWVNIGDTYNASSYKKDEKSNNHGKQGTNKGTYENVVERPMDKNSKAKDLIGIPWMLAFALRADGWYLRQDIIWHKPNPMPESVKDRCTKAHEYIFLLSKSPIYYFDYEAIQEEATGYDGRKDTLLKGSKKYSDGNYYPSNMHINSLSSSGHERWKWKSGYKNLEYDGQTPNTMHIKRLAKESDDIYPVRNKRDVWAVPLSPYKGAHFATFPKKLIEPCILAGCPKDGIVLDPFNGSGTTGVVSMENDRKYIGIELNQKFIDMTIDRFEKLEGISKIMSNDGVVIKVKKETLW